MIDTKLLKQPGGIVTLLTLVLIPFVILFADFSKVKTANSEKQKAIEELESSTIDYESIDPSLLEGLDDDLGDLDLDFGEDEDSLTSALNTGNDPDTTAALTKTTTKLPNKDKQYKLYLLLAWGILLLAFLSKLFHEKSGFKAAVHKSWLFLENNLSIVMVVLLIIFTLNSLLEKTIKAELIYDSTNLLTHSVILIALLGAALAFRNREHISLTITEYILPENKLQIVATFTATITSIILFTFFFSALEWPQTFDVSRKLFKLPLNKILYIIPVGLLIISLRASLQKLKTSGSLLPIVLGITIPFIIKFLFPTELPTEILYGSVILLIIGTFLGVPIFTALTGFAMLFIYNEEHGSLVRVLTETYEVLTLEEYATIPLFTISGFLLSFSKSGERLIRFFKALFGPIPGGIAIVAVLVSAFFTTFTGASGVTILALGGLLHYIMTKDGYSERFTTGYLTSSGSIGLLFPPALPIILFGVQAQVNIIKLFAGGFLPGVLLVTSISLYGIYKSTKIKDKKRIPFSFKELAISFKEAIWEIILPIIIIYLFFSGKAVIVETAAFSVLYLLIVQLFVHKDIKANELPRIFLKAASVAGSVLIILVGAKALSSQIIFAQIPQKLALWCQAHIHHKWVFLLILNVALLVTGFFMDIFSAIMVVVPLILPISDAFGIDRVHLGIIFLANLEVGYLTPPVGLNLFLSALTFKQSLIKIYRSVLPFLVIMITAVLIITYFPFLTNFGVSMSEKLGLYKNNSDGKIEMNIDKESKQDSTIVSDTLLISVPNTDSLTNPL